jgi:DNA repair protein RecO
MPQGHVKAFVLTTTPIIEQDKFVHIFSLNRGILKAIAPGSLKNKNRFGALLELFTEGEFHYYWKEDRDTNTISKGEILHSYFNTVSSPDNIFYFYLMAETLLKFIPCNQQDKRIYRLIHSILTNRVEGVDMNLLLLYFFTWILRIEGMMFNPLVCQNCFKENPEIAWLRTDFRGILCKECKSDEQWVLQNQELQYLKWTHSHPPKDSHLWKDKINPAKMIRLLKNKIEFHGEFSFKSAQYLSEFN